MGRHLRTLHRAVLTSQKLAKSNVQTSLCDRREPANASSLYLALHPRPQQSASMLKNQRKRRPKKEDRRRGEVIQINSSTDCILAVLCRDQSKKNNALDLRGRSNRRSHLICRRSAMAAHDDDGPCRTLHVKFLHGTDAPGANRYANRAPHGRTDCRQFVRPTSPAQNSA